MINRRLALLLLAAVAVAGYVHWTDEGSLLHRWTGGSDRQAAVPGEGTEVTAKPAERRTAANPLRGLGPEQLAEITARPLFNPTRAPAPQPEVQAPEPVAEVEQPPPEPAINIADFTLLAVASGATGNMAVVRQNSTSEFFHLKQGDSLAELQVAEIGARQIKLTLQDQTYELKLFERRDSVTPPPAMQDSEPQPIEEGQVPDGQPDPNQPQNMQPEETQGLAPRQMDPTIMQRMNADNR